MKVWAKKNPTPTRAHSTCRESPSIACTRVSGDQGETRLAGGQRVANDALRIEAYGTVDELNCFVGLARALAEETINRDGRAWPLYLS
jgi:hypothetical protein